VELSELPSKAHRIPLVVPLAETVGVGAANAKLSEVVDAVEITPLVVLNLKALI
jgi:hypothetical protein